MSEHIESTVLLSAYACCPGRGSAPRSGWKYLLMSARAYRKVILLTSVTDYQRVEKELAAMGIRNVSLVVIRMPFRLDRLHSVRVGGIHLHYWLWLSAAKRAVRKLRDKVDFAHHITYGSLQFGSPIYGLPCSFIFGPVGRGRVT